MDNVVICQDCEAYIPASAAVVSTATSFTDPAATTTEPTANVIDLRRQGAVPQWLELVPYGVGDANDVFEMWVIGWRKINTLWVPKRLVKLTCTLGTAVGVAGASVADTDKFCDTITATGGISNVSYQLFSTTDNTPAHALVSPNGNELIQFTFDMTTGDPTSGKCLVARV